MASKQGDVGHLCLEAHSSVKQEGGFLFIHTPFWSLYIKYTFGSKSKHFEDIKEINPVQLITLILKNDYLSFIKSVWSKDNGLKDSHLCLREKSDNIIYSEGDSRHGGSRDSHIGIETKAIPDI